MLFERLDHKYVLTIEDDNAGCTLMVEHFHYEQSPALIDLQWAR